MISGVLNPEINLLFMNVRFTITGKRIQSILALHIVLIASLFSLKAQQDTIKYDISVSGLISSGNNAPFWMQSRDYSKTSSAPQSADLMLGINKDLKKNMPLFDYGFKANLLVRTDKLKSDAYFQELYAKMRLSVIDLIIGSREEHLGNQDSALSCGGLLFSENTRPMPKVTIGIEHFVPVPLTNGFLEVKGALAHGWFTDNIYATGELLHHKYAYLKLGGKWPVHFQYGLDHVAEWGGNIPGLGQQPTSFKDYISIFLGRSGGTNAPEGEQINMLGNHIISQSMRLDIDISDFKIGGYWQNISEDGPIRLIGFTMNKPDGLWGISIRNKNFPFVKGILYEYLNTTDQSGQYHDLDGVIYGGNDGYFSNYIYQSGWSYFSRTIGTPFIAGPISNSAGALYSKNNRVQVHHIGLEGDISGYKYKFISSFSKNYGAYYYPFLQMIQNTSMLLEVNKQLPTILNLEIGCRIGADFGQLYGNSVGCQISIRKTGNLFRY